jgi:hypothetical protein
MPVCRKGNRAIETCIAFCIVCWRRYAVVLGGGLTCDSWCEMVYTNPLAYDTRAEIERRRGCGELLDQGDRDQGEVSL